MEKTTVYLPSGLKGRIKRAAHRRGQSEAEFIRAALEQSVANEPRPLPNLGVGSSGDPTLAERVDDLLAEGFGEPHDR